MRTKKYFLSGVSILLGMALAGCGSSLDSGGNQTVPPTAGAALYVGSEVCGTCHQDIYDSVLKSGHPYKLNKVVNDTMPTYPFSSILGALEQVTDEDGVTDNTLGTPVTYADVTYVIGGYGWKARFIDNNGFIVTGTKVQYNLEDGSMVAYHDNGVDVPYNCGNCHTTGWQHYDATLNDNHQDNLAGMDGTFVAPGVHCEACHGGGLNHVASQEEEDITKQADARTTSDFLKTDMGLGLAVACSECHTRDGEKDYPTYVSAYNTAFPDGPREGGRIAASGGLAKHHEQYDEMLGVDPDNGNPLGKHLAAGVTCIVCHDPHKTVKHQADAGESGLIAECLDCHGAGKPFEMPMPADSNMAGLDCLDCHMPMIAKSALSHAAVGTGPVTGDIKGHIFKIDLTKVDQTTADGKFFYPWLTKKFACLKCHNGVDQFDLSNVDVSTYRFHQADTDAIAAGITNDYTGSANCSGCHEEDYNEFIDSGHPYKLNKVVSDTMPTYPFSSIAGALEQVTDEDGITDNTLGTPVTYADVTYVIGGYGWKARFIDNNGFIVTGTKVQYNLEDGSMVAYHDNGVDVPYNCGNCHTTGWQHYDATLNDNRQDDLAGMDGTFAAPGVHCEACHGAGLRHLLTANPAYITEVATPRTLSAFQMDDMAYGKPVACSECHTRDGEKDYPSYVSGAQGAGYTDAGFDEGGRIAASGGLGQHHEQFDELLGIDPDDVAAGGLGKHLAAGVTCIVCHDPHKTVKRQAEAGESGLIVDCLDCHGEGEANEVAMPEFSSMKGFDCTDCHMPMIAKSAVSHAAVGTGPVTGDIKGHIFKIDLTKADQTTADGKFLYPWLTKKFACLKCHNGVVAPDRSGIDDSGFIFHPAT